MKIPNLVQTFDLRLHIYVVKPKFLPIETLSGLKCVAEEHFFILNTS